MRISSSISSLYARHAAKQRVYQDIKNYSTTLNSLLRAVGDISVEFIDYNTIITWKAYLEETGKSSTTICGYLSTLKRF